MINLFKKNIHSFLSFTTTTDTTTTTATITSTSNGDYKLQLQRPRHPILGLGLINATRDTNRTLNVLESAQLKKPDDITSSMSPSKRIGFIDDIGGEVDGLMSCTESLGFESSDERRVNDELMDEIHSKNDNDNDHDNKKEEEEEEEDNDDDHVWRRRMMMSAEGRGNWKKVRSFPPPLSWLNRNGKPSFVLRPVRKDGRLELTEVRIQRPEILHASRHDGRLTLHLIPDHSIEEEEELDALLDEELDDEEIMVHEEEEEEGDELDAMLDEEIMVDDDEEEEGEVVEGIRYEKEEEDERVGMGRNEGLRRCYEMVNQHHHHHVHGNHHHHHHLRMSGINICVPC